MHDTSAHTLAHALRARRERLLPALHSHRIPVAVQAWDAPGEPVPFAAARAAVYRPLAAGERWGPPWATTWLRIRARVPAGWPAEEVEAIVDLGFLGAAPGFQAEGLAWSADGEVLKGVEPRNSYVRIPGARPGGEVLLYVEAAANPDIARGWKNDPTPLGSLSTAGSDPLYVFGGASLAIRDLEVSALDHDWWTLLDLARELPAPSVRRARIVAALADASAVLDPDDVPGTAAKARALLAGVLAEPAAASAHRITAVGHAHIDSAWLWPVRETIRKCGRTFSNVLDLMAEYPEFVFAASSAQQYAWMRDHYPALFERIRARVAEGRWIPTGRMWVESDTNMPGGEALVRQFLFGVRFFTEHFGTADGTVWLPDTFGYTAALPQLALGAGATSLLTQKPCWNDTNRMPHHTFLWEGIDGSRLFTHFPPVDTYNVDMGAADLARAERQHAEAGASDRSIAPFGYGDGGGGPTREMIELGRRKRDLEGSPRVEFGGPAPFYAAARAELPEPPVWTGEMYLEYHRGTYTSQASTKHGNRRSEALLHEAELWATTAAVRAGAAYPVEELRCAWETVLLQQFHDILPGSSIAWVHEEAERRYAEIAERLEALIAASLEALGSGSGSGSGDVVAFNASPFPVQGVPAFGADTPAAAAPRRTVADGDGWLLRSDAVQARFDSEGYLVGLRELATGRELVPAGTRGNEFQLFRDLPNEWDAWDIDRSYRRMRVDDVETEAVAVDGDALVVRRRIGRSGVQQRITLSPDGGALEVESTVDWHETRKLLKLAFPIDVAADRALSEIQFGYYGRPIHTNTPWDAARFETVAHRWIRVADGRAGVTLANDRTYGHDVTREQGLDGSPVAIVRASLLRSSRYPDPRRDEGRHVFRHSLRPGSILDGIAEGYRLRVPLRQATGAAVAPLAAIDPASGVVVETVKLAEDGSGDVIVRGYEALGGRATARLELGFAADRTRRVDLLEHDLAEQPADALQLELRAFEVATVRVQRA